MQEVFMDINQFLTYLESYGLTIMFIVVMLEYLNFEQKNLYL